MSEQKYTTSARFLKFFAYILMGTGLIFTMLAMSSFFMGLSLDFLEPIYMLLIGLLLLFAGVPLLAVAQQGIIKQEFDTLSIIKCTGLPDCKFVRAKKFERGEYIFQELEDKCEKCNSPLYIAAIFEVDKTPPKQKQEEAKKDQESQKKDELPTPKIIDTL
ncbi:MAG: hypothetical protein HWN66_18065 [Candidatus Helarchaeota archaeon]|nr:hypothetical protein [Candidatus Helarchaeota archaeon]